MRCFYSDEDYSYSLRQDKKLLRNLNTAIIDELSAIHYYTRLAEMTPNEQVRKQILAVRQDEINHFAQFSRMYYELSQAFPPLSLSIGLPKSYKHGVRESIKDEQQTVPFYMNIASRLTNPSFKGIFINAANDEQRHYQLFSHLNSYI